jgi:hypothetical protein
MFTFFVLSFSLSLSFRPAPDGFGCVDINAAFHQGGRFEFVFGETRRNQRQRFDSGTACVTAMAFFPEICSLAVGYNFGAFHFWCLGAGPTLV